MRSTYTQFQNMSPENINNIHQHGILIFDTNVLLNLYRYTSKTREAILNVISSLRDRVWMPNHISFEFQKNRCEVIYETEDNYKFIAEKTKEFVKSCQTILRINDEKIINKLSSVIDKWIAETKKDNVIVSDPSQDKLIETLFYIFENRIGQPYSDATLNAVKQEGDDRFKREVPPGYKDAKKGTESIDNNKYGDLIIWKQIIEFAKTNDKDIIFVTDDAKEDWWQIIRGRKRGPRYELKKEFSDNTNRSFIMYNIDSFLLHFSKNTNQEIIDEINSISIRSNESQEKINMDLIKLKLEKIRISMKIKELHNENDQLQKMLSNEENAISDLETLDNGNVNIQSIQRNLMNNNTQEKYLIMELNSINKTFEDYKNNKPN